MTFLTEKNMKDYHGDVLGQLVFDFYKETTVPEQNKHKPQLIGLTGKARSGKDTVAGMLAETYGATTVAFAEPIKDALMAMMKLSWDHLYGDLKEAVLPWLGKSPRQIMQTLGTDWGRKLVNEDLWLILARRQIEDYLNKGYHVVLTDVRFENEAALVRELGGTVWHIRRDNAQKVNEHASEAGVNVAPVVDKIIYNNGSLEDLAECVVEEFTQ